MDIFTQNLWTEREQIELITRQPYVPGLLGRIFNWQEKGLRNKIAFIENRDGVVSLVPSSPRGSAPIEHRPSGRQARPITIPHFSIADHINADEVLGQISWNNPQALKSVQEEAESRMPDMTRKLDVTLEHLRSGALKGLVLDSTGEQLADIYDLTGQVQHAEVNLDLGNSTAGVIYQNLVDLKRLMRRLLKGDGDQMTGVVILCDATLMDNFRKSKDYVDRHNIALQDLAMRLNEITDTVTWLGFTFVEYEPGQFGPTGEDKFFGVGKGIAVPVGLALDIFRTYYAPADYIDTVNQRAQPRYVRPYTDPRNKFWEIEYQTNPLPFITRPEAIIRVDDGV
jgi:hypothetical protein